MTLKTPIIRTLLNLFLLIYIFFSFTAISLSSDYYIDYVNGNNLHEGTTSAAPWKHSPGDPNATGIPASTTLQPGDTLRFRDNVRYIGSINISSSGTEEEPIVFSGTWSTGRAVIDCAGTYYHAFAVGNVSNIIIRGFDITGYKNTLNGTYRVERGIVTYTGSGKASDNGAIRLNRSRNILIDNCIIYEAEDWSDLCVPNAESDGDDLTSAGVPALQSAIYLSRTLDIEIKNSEFYATGKDIIHTSNVRNLKIENCNFGGSGRGDKEGYFSVAIRYYKADNVDVTNSIFHDGWQYEGDDSEGQRCHAGDWLHIYGAPDGTAPSKNLIIERNLFYNKRNFQNKRGTAMIYPEGGSHDIWIRNNLFLNSHFSNGVIFLKANCFNNFIHNNTFVMWGLENGAINAINLQPALGPGNEIINNIFLDLSERAVQLVYYIPGGTVEARIDSNIYYKPNDEDHIIARLGSSWINFEQWKRASGQDAHSFYENPLLAIVPESGSESDQGAYWPTSGSRAIDGGIALSGVSRDFRGVLRPEGGEWDVGAFEVLETTPASSPRNLRLVPEMSRIHRALAAVGN